MISLNYNILYSKWTVFMYIILKHLHFSLFPVNYIMCNFAEWKCTNWTYRTFIHSYVAWELNPSLLSSSSFVVDPLFTLACHEAMKMLFIMPIHCRYTCTAKNDTTSLFKMSFYPGYTNVDIQRFSASGTITVNG